MDGWTKQFNDGGAHACATVRVTGTAYRLRPFRVARRAPGAANAIPRGRGANNTVSCAGAQGRVGSQHVYLSPSASSALPATFLQRIRGMIAQTRPFAGAGMLAGFPPTQFPPSWHRSSSSGCRGTLKSSRWMLCLLERAHTTRAPFSSL